MENCARGRSNGPSAPEVPRTCLYHHPDHAQRPSPQMSHGFRHRLVVGKDRLVHVAATLQLACDLPLEELARIQNYQKHLRPEILAKMKTIKRPWDQPWKT